MTTSQLPGPLWFRIMVGGVVWFAGAAAVLAGSSMNARPDPIFLAVADAVVVGLVVAGVAFIVVGFELRSRAKTR